MTNWPRTGVVGGSSVIHGVESSADSEYGVTSLCGVPVLVSDDDWDAEGPYACVRCFHAWHPKSTRPVLALVPEEKVHARLSPSKAHRWLPCPGSLKVQDTDPESEWAAEGTRKHEVLRRVLGGEAVLAGDVVMDRPVAKETVEQCVEVKAFVEQWESQHAGWVVERETRIEVGTYAWAGLARGDCAGTADVAGYSPEGREVLVLDGKFGWVRVEARDNPQLNMYAIGLCGELEAIFGTQVENVSLVIAQPDYSGEMEFREHRTTREHLMQWAFEQQAVIDEIVHGSRRLQADDKACRYCPARTYCPARLKAMEDFNADEFIQAHKLHDLLPYVPRLRAICKDLEQKAVMELNAGRPVPGFKLVASRSKRRWPVDGEDKVAEALASHLGYKKPSEEMFDRKLKSPAQMEKLLRSAANRTAKAAKEIVNQVAFVPEGAPKLAPESDERPALDAGQFTLEDALKASLEDFNETD